MAESEEKLKSPLMKVKEESGKASLKLSTFKKLRSALWRVNAATIGKAEMCLQMGLSARAEHPCKRGILPKSLDTALSLMVHVEGAHVRGKQERERERVLNTQIQLWNVWKIYL